MQRTVISSTYDLKMGRLKAAQTFKSVVLGIRHQF